MDAAGVLPAFGGIAVHDAWAPYDTYPGVAGHALCNAHALRELQAVTDSAPSGQWCRAAQAADALREMKRLADTALAAGGTLAGIDAGRLAAARHQFRLRRPDRRKGNRRPRRAAHGKAPRPRPPAAPARNDYLRFTTDPCAPFDNNAAEREIRMSKLRIKVSGCMRSMAGAEAFRAIRSYLSTAAKHDTGILHALTTAASGMTWIPGTS